MNATLDAHARAELKRRLPLLPQPWQDLFKRMYGTDSGRIPLKDVLERRIEDVVDGLPSEKLDWALTQVENSEKKLKGKTP